MSENKLKVGVVGLGWAGETHLKGYLAQPNVEVVAIADAHPPHLERVGETYNVPHRYTDWQDLVASDLDIVSVATPNFLHAPVAVAALNAGKHVLSEKPLARTTEEAQSMVSAAQANGRVLHVAFNHRQRGDVQALKKYIDSGAFGNVYHAKASWMRRNGIPGMGGWFTNKETAGGGPLIDIGVHVLDMAMHLLGEPKAVTVTGAAYTEFGNRGRGGSGYATPVTTTNTYDVEDLATAFIRFENGATLLLEASWASYSRLNEKFGVTLYGTEAGAEIAVIDSDEDTLSIFTDAAGVPADIFPHVKKGEGHLAVVCNFVNVIRSGDWAGHDGRDGLYRTQIIEACYESAKTGREVVLS